MASGIGLYAHTSGVTLKGYREHNRVSMRHFGLQCCSLPDQIENISFHLQLSIKQASDQSIRACTYWVIGWSTTHQVDISIETDG